MIDAGNSRVVALMHQLATGKESGVPIEMHFGVLYELEDGRVIRIRNYLHPAEALEAAGLQQEFKKHRSGRTPQLKHDA